MSTIVLAGGNEFRENCVTMDREVLRATAKRPARVVILPTAARDHPTLAAGNGVRYFQELGAAATSAHVVDQRTANDPAQVAPLHGADVIYLVGGNPWYLLETLRGSLALEAIRDAFRAGALIAGSSAGAMVLAERMVTADWSSWTPALGLASAVGIVPHHHQEDERAARLRSAAGSELSILGIEEATACIGDGLGTWRVIGIGRVSVYTGPDQKTFRPGETIRLP